MQFLDWTKHAHTYRIRSNLINDHPHLPDHTHTYRIWSNLINRSERPQVDWSTEVVVSRHLPLSVAEKVDGGKIDACPIWLGDVHERCGEIVQGQRTGVLASERVQQLCLRVLLSNVSVPVTTKWHTKVSCNVHIDHVHQERACECQQHASTHSLLPQVVRKRDRWREKIHGEKCDCMIRQASQGTKFTEIQRKLIKNRIRATAGAAGHALGLAVEPSQSDERAKRQKKKIVIVGEGKVPESLDEGMRTSSCLPKTRLHNFIRNPMCSCVAEVQHEEQTPVLPTSPFSHHFKILANPIPQLLSVCCFHPKCKKDTLQIDPELPR